MWDPTGSESTSVGHVSVRTTRDRHKWGPQKVRVSMPFKAKPGLVGRGTLLFVGAVAQFSPLDVIIYSRGFF